jgi:hypothetical protein
MWLTGIKSARLDTPDRTHGAISSVVHNAGIFTDHQLLSDTTDAPIGLAQCCRGP